MPRTHIVAVDMSPAVVHVEVSSLDEEQDVAGFEDVAVHSVAEVSKALKAVAELVKDAVATSKPTKTSVQFGVEMAIESGKLTALLLVKGTATANLKVTLEWA